jgi:predicted MFS family arabinose efflux permease
MRLRRAYVLSGADAVGHQFLTRPHPRKVFQAMRGGSPRVALALLAFMLALDYGDRTLIGAMGPTIKTAFHIGNTDLGLLATAVNIVAALTALPIGMLTDRVHRMRLLAIAVVLWTGATIIVGASVSFLMLFGSRLLLAAIAATSGPTVPSLIGDLVPAADRGRALGFVDSGQLAGIGAGFLLGAFVTSFLSFRWGFWLLSCSGAVLAIAFWLQREPRRTGAAGPRGGAGGESSVVEQAVDEGGIEPSREAIVRRDPLSLSMWDVARYVIRVRTNAIVLIARSIGDYFLAAVSTFAVVFASKQYGISPQLADLGILALGIGALAGVLVMGRVGDALLARGWANARLLLGALGYLLGPIFLAPALLIHTLAIALPLISIGAFFLAGTGPALDAVRVDVLVPRLRGRSEAVRGVLRTAAEAAAPVLFAVLAANLAAGDAGLQLAFLATLPALALSGLVLLIGLRTYQPDVAAALVSGESKTDGRA